MKFFSSFDTNLKHNFIQKAVQEYGQDNVFVVTRDNLYFFNKVILRLIAGILMTILIRIGRYLMFKDQWMIYGIILWCLTWLPLFLYALDNYMDYKMNYAIFTPSEATLIEQASIFKRNIRTLDIKKIKSVNIKKTSIIYSIFNSGMLNIISEWSEALWEINFKYVNNPESAQSEIKRLMMQWPNRRDYHNTESL